MQSLKGMRDILPKESGLFEFVVQRSRQICTLYGFHEIITPVLEKTSLFKKSIGETTDIVQKEMYAFTDRGGRDICLRPEGTAAIVRAVLQHGLIGKNQITKLFYAGPMFRAERPQAGRMRQFYQIGVEAVGSHDVLLDAEVIALNARLLEEIGIKDCEIKINSLGSDDDKNNFRKLLRDRLKSHGYHELCATCHTRFETNVLRILDCKDKGCQKIARDVVANISHLSGESLEKYDRLKNTLRNLGITFVENPYIVRGLDYYTHTVFEITSQSLGAQDALSAGGRYDNLFRSMGSRENVGAFGFAMGVDRIMMILGGEKALMGKIEKKTRPDVFMIALGDAAKREAFCLQNELRGSDISVTMDFFDKPLKKQLGLASKAGAYVSCIIGENEIKEKKVRVKIMRREKQDNNEQLVDKESLPAELGRILKKERGVCV